MTDLFSALDYPNVAGSKRVGTSEQAAREITPTIKGAHAVILKAYAGRDMTADECAAVIGRSILYCRPRISELVALGKLHDTNTTRPNASGKRAAVLGVRG